MNKTFAGDLRPLLQPPLALCCSLRAPSPGPRHAFPVAPGSLRRGMIRGDRFRAALASSRRQGRCDRTEPSQTRWPRRACGELLTRPESRCPIRTVAMGKGSTRGHHPPPGPRNHRGARELPGSPWQRAPARIPAPRPSGAWLLGPMDGRGPRRPGTEMASQSRGWWTEGWGGDRCGTKPRKRARGASGAGWGPEGAGSALGTVGERRCRLHLRPLLHSRPPRLVRCRLQVVMNTLKRECCRL